MSDEIKTGDTVTLKSGSPTMTVNTVADQYGTVSAWCVWLEGKKQCNGTFPLTSLKKG